MGIFTRIAFKMGKNIKNVKKIILKEVWHFQGHNSIQIIKRGIKFWYSVRQSVRCVAKG